MSDDIGAPNAIGQLHVDRVRVQYAVAFAPGTSELPAGEALRLETFLDQASLRPDDHVYVASPSGDPLRAGTGREDRGAAGAARGGCRSGRPASRRPGRPRRRARRPLCRDGADLSRLVRSVRDRPRQLAEQQFRLRHASRLRADGRQPARPHGRTHARPGRRRADHRGRRALPHRTSEGVPRQRRHRYGIGRGGLGVVEPILEFVGKQQRVASASGGAGSSATAAATGAAGAGGTGAGQ